MRSRSLRCRSENAEKLVTLNMNAVKLALAQGVEGAQAVRVGEGRSRSSSPCVPSSPKRRANAMGYSRGLYELVLGARKPNSPRWPKKPGRPTPRAVATFVDNASKSAPAGVRCRRQCVQVDHCRFRRLRSTSSIRPRSKS